MEFNFKQERVDKKLYQLTLERLKSQGVDIDIDTISSIIKSKWEFITYVIRFGQYESYRDKYLGNFGVKKWRPATKEYRLMKADDRAYADCLEGLERWVWLDKKHTEYREAHKFEDNKLYFPVIMTDKKGKETEFNTLKEASEITKIEPIHIYISCSKKTKTKKGLQFKFKTIDGNKD